MPPARSKSVPGRPDEPVPQAVGVGDPADLNQVMLPVVTKRQTLSSKESRGRTQRRMSFNLRATDEERLRLVAERLDGTENDALRRALATTAYFQRLIDDGGTVIVEDAQGRQRIIEFLLE